MPLYIRFRRIDGVEPKFPLGIDLLSEEWDEEKQRILDSNKDIILQREVIRIRQEVCRYEMDGVELTKDMLREVVSQKQARAGKPENQSFYRFFDDCVSKRTKTGRIGQSTVMGYETTRRALKEFRAEIRIKDISAKLLSDFDRFLIRRGQKSDKGDVEGSRFNRMKHIRTVIRHVENQKIPIDNPFRTEEMVIREPPANGIFLETKEFKALVKVCSRETQIGTPEFYAVAMFLFSCQTGLRLSDVLSLRWGEVDRSAEPWVINKILKKRVGGKEVEIHTPIPQYAVYLMDWSQEESYYMDIPDRLVFPTIHPNTINKILRVYAEKADIKKHLTFHAARRTYATTLAIKGLDNKVLMRLMGHNNFNSTLRYTKWSTEGAREYAEHTEVIKVKPLRIK